MSVILTGQMGHLVLPVVTELITCYCLEQETVTLRPDRHIAAAEKPSFFIDVNLVFLPKA